MQSRSKKVDHGVIIRDTKGNSLFRPTDKTPEEMKKLWELFAANYDPSNSYGVILEAMAFLGLDGDLSYKEKLKKMKETEKEVEEKLKSTGVNGRIDLWNQIESSDKGCNTIQIMSTLLKVDENLADSYSGTFDTNQVLVEYVIDHLSQFEQRIKETPEYKKMKKQKLMREMSEEIGKEWWHYTEIHQLLKDVNPLTITVPRVGGEEVIEISRTPYNGGGVFEHILYHTEKSTFPKIFKKIKIQSTEKYTLDELHTYYKELGEKDPNSVLYIVYPDNKEFLVLGTKKVQGWDILGLVYPKIKQEKA